MAREVIGLRVGSSRLTAARVETNGGISLAQIASSELTPGLVVRGEVQSAHNLAAELKVFFKENKLPTKGVRVGVASNRLGVRTIEIVGKLDDTELSNAVTFRAQEDLPIPVMDASLDYEVIDQWTNDEGEPVRRVLVAVAYRELVDEFANAFEIAGIKLVGIDLEALAMIRALTPPSSTNFDDGHAASATVMINLGSDHAVVAITDGRTMEYARVVEWGGSTVTDVLATALEVPSDEAESIKCGLSEGDSASPDGLTPENAARAREVIDEQVTAFARELVSTLQYYQGQPHSLAISHIVLAGGGARLSGILATLERLTGVPVRIGDPTVRLHSFPNDDNWTPGPELAVPIGLGMGQ